MFKASQDTCFHRPLTSQTRRAGVTRGLLVAPLLLLSGAQLLTGCQDVSEPKIVLTQAQWKEVEKHILKEEPSPQHKLNVNYGNEIELIGFDVEPAELEAGKQATFTWYWKALKAPSKNWEVFIHFDAKDKPLRQGLDHHPVDGLFKTSLWKKGQIIKDIQTVTIREDFPTTDAVPYIGLYHGNGVDARLMIVNGAEKTEDRRAVGPTLKVKGGKGAVKADARNKPQTPPIYSPAKWTAEQVKGLELDGKIEEELWASVPTAKLEPFGKGQNQATWAKIAYTDDALYIAAHLEDGHIWGNLKDRDSSTWKEEVFELFLDTNRDGKDYLELQVTPNNVVFDANFKTRLGTGEGSTEEQIKAASAWNYEGLVSAVHVDGTLNDVEKEDKFWSVELKLPFAALPGADGGKAPANGTSWALNMYRFDRPTKEQSFAYAWSRLTRGTFHDVPKFGVLRFGSTIDKNQLMLLRQQQGDRSRSKPLGAPVKLTPSQKQQLKIDPRTLRRKMPTPSPLQLKPHKGLEKK